MQMDTDEWKLMNADFSDKEKKSTLMKDILESYTDQGTKYFMLTESQLDNLFSLIKMSNIFRGEK